MDENRISFPSNTKDTNAGSLFLSPPHGSHPLPLQQAVCLTKAGECQCRKEHSTNVLQSSIFAILRPTTGEKTDMPLGNQGRNLSYALFTNRNNSSRTSAVQTGSEETSTHLICVAGFSTAEGSARRWLVGAPRSGFLT